MKKTIVWSVIVLLAGTACTKNKIDAMPFISHVSPLQGQHGTEVSIAGRYLRSTAGSTFVRFNNVEADIVSFSDTLLKVKVPKGAETGDITIVSGGRVIHGPEFTYDYTVTVSTVAGNGMRGFTEGNAKAASLYSPGQMVFDKEDNLYFLDQAGAAIRKLTPAGALITYAGNGASTSTPVDGAGINARFGNLRDICFDMQAQALYAVDFYGSLSFGSRIIKVTPEDNLGKVSTIFSGGAASWGYLDNSNLSNAKFRDLRGCVADAAGNLYVMDAGNYCVRKIAFNGTGVSTLAGKGIWGHIDGQGTDALFTDVFDLTRTAAGDLLATEWSGSYIRKVTLTGITSTLTGNGVHLDSDGTLTTASVNLPDAAASDNKGNVYVITGGLNRLRMITAAGRVLTLLSNPYGYQDGPGAEAKFLRMGGIAVDSKGHVFIADQGNRRIRKVIIE